MFRCRIGIGESQNRTDKRVAWSAIAPRRGGTLDHAEPYAKTDLPPCLCRVRTNFDLHAIPRGAFDLVQ